MTKKELAALIADTSDGISQAKATEMIDKVFAAIKTTLDSGEEVTLRGFGTWMPVVSAPRSGRNLRTAERVKIPSKVRIKFRSYMNEKEAE